MTRGTRACPSDERLLLYLEGQAGASAAELSEHIAGCSHCAAVLAALDSAFDDGDSGDQHEPSTGLAEPRPGDRIGRYRVIERVGAGAMGVVFAAFDPELNRRVALKLLRHLGGDSEAQRARFLKEAQAVASLSHPNVIAVHDVGIEDGAAFFAMEFVQGVTLRRWLETPRPIEDVVATVAAAGRGLAEAHRAELVHRDFKPDNVLVGVDGRPRVIDFGLVRAAAPRGSASRDDAAADGLATEAGTLVGTPAYMAPEQLAGQRADERSDQFSFCVVLFEAVMGRRPFVGSTLLELDEAMRDGLGPWPSTPRLGRSLRRVLERGLSLQRMDRFDSMDDLIELLSGPGLARRAQAAVAVGMLGLAVGVYGMVSDEGRAQCPSSDGRLETIWNPTVAATMETRVAEHNPTLARWTTQSLDDYAKRWTRAHHEACVATVERKEQSWEAMDLRMQCLNAARIELGATVSAIVEGQGSAIADAERMVGGLPALAGCNAIERLRSLTAPSEAIRDGMAELQAEVAEVRVLARAGERMPALERAEALTPRVTELAFEPYELLHLTHVADLRSRASNVEGAERLYEQALQRSLASGVPEPAFRAATGLACIAVRRGDWQRAQAYGATAMGLQDDPRVTGSGGKIEVCLARAAGMAGDREAEAELHAAAVDASAVQRGADDVRTHVYRLGLARGLRDRGHFERAEALARQSIEGIEKVVGPDHPWSANARLNLAQTLIHLDALDEAEELLTGLVALWQRAAGPGRSTDEGTVHGVLGNLYKSQERYDEAIEAFRRSEAIASERLGPNAPNAIIGRLSIALSMGDAGELEAAVQALDRVRADIDKRWAEGHVLWFEVRLNTCRFELERGNMLARRPDLESMVEFCDANPDAATLHCGDAFSLLGRALLEAGEIARAREHADRAVTLLDSAAGVTDIQQGALEDLRARLTAAGD